MHAGVQGEYTTRMKKFDPPMAQTLPSACLLSTLNRGWEMCGVIGIDVERGIVDVIYMRPVAAGITYLV